MRVDVDRGVAVVTLDRPAVLNAFDARMGAEDAYLACDADDAVGAVVVTGAGRACCSGADLSPGAAVFGAVDATTFRSDPFTVHAWDVRKPVVAAMNGHAIGLALTLAL